MYYYHNYKYINLLNIINNHDIDVYIIVIKYYYFLYKFLLFYYHYYYYLDNLYFYIKMDLI